MKKYFIDIDPNSEHFSENFKDFYYYHFINSNELSKREIPIDFFKNMNPEEKEIVKHLIRNNLELRKTHLFDASGILKDKMALPILFEQFEKDENLSMKLTIGRAIWRITEYQNYEKILRELAMSNNENLKYNHFEKFSDLTQKVKIELLTQMVGDNETPSERKAFETLNILQTRNELEKDRTLENSSIDF
jgi:hypothetical protein